jgi:hypothetical protein
MCVFWVEVLLQPCYHVNKLQCRCQCSQLSRRRQRRRKYLLALEYCSCFHTLSSQQQYSEDWLIDSVTFGGAVNRNNCFWVFLFPFFSFFFVPTTSSRVRYPMRWIFLIYLILPVALGPGVYSASNGNEYWNIKIIMFLGSKVRRVRRADNFTAICEPIV